MTYFLEKHEKHETLSLFRHFSVTFDENILTEQISKCVILVILAHFGHHWPFPTRDFVLGAVLR